MLWSLLGVLFLAALFLGHQYDVQPDNFIRLPLILLYAFDPILLLFLAGIFFYSRPIDRRDRKAPVSYTHLDVYKRQGVALINAQNITDLLFQAVHLISIALLPKTTEAEQILADLRSGQSHGFP